MNYQQSMAESRAMVADGNFSGAVNTLTSLLAVYPADKDVLAGLCIANFRLNQYADALFYLESLIAQFPLEVKWHEQAATITRIIQEQHNAGEILSSVLARHEGPYITALIYGAQLQQTQQPDNAFVAYTNAIKWANAKGFWFNDGSTVEWCRPLVLQAIAFLDQHRKNVAAKWKSELSSQFDKTRIERVLSAIDLFSGVTSLSDDKDRARAGFLFIPDLPNKPYYKAEELPFAASVESQSASVIAEVRQLLDNQASFPAFDHNNEPGKSLTTGGDWDAFFFYRHGKVFADNLTKCPATAKVLESLPLVKIPGYSPEVCFSILRPHTRIKPHRGVTNSRMVFHMGLVVPDNCRLNIINEKECQWSEGKTFAFDDTYLHEAWNESDTNRVVLLADIWHPDLNEAEQQAIASLVQHISTLNKGH